jgi:hypothetical protein
MHFSALASLLLAVGYRCFKGSYRLATFCRVIMVSIKYFHKGMLCVLGLWYNTFWWQGAFGRDDDVGNVTDFQAWRSPVGKFPI